ncbi:unnamed protein product [Ranitomeya imitator]|uniref:Helix-turn-helix domain-containing protein n=1 Tax=Ranitomeya imitator TaxID=111125 RepID=A0ABN9MNB1_9NEOB|nr:unnamed protein product [Ranitomeya imitator]
MTSNDSHLLCFANIQKNLKKPPGRPIVASTDSILSPLSILLEKVLTLLIKKTPAFLLDTGAFLQIIHELGKTTGGYTFGNRIRATEQLLNMSQMDPRVISFLLDLLKLVLIENFITFKDTFYVQVHGTAMGSNVAPTHANGFMFTFESEFIYSNKLYQSHFILWRRYIDDVFCLWRGSHESLLRFFDQINSVWPELSFTLKYDCTEINFLDTKVIQKSDGTLMVDLYMKDTDRNNLLLYQSCHPNAVKRSIPRSQFERVRRIVSDSTLCSQRLDEMEKKFLQRGYCYDLVALEQHETYSGEGGTYTDRKP